jgi:hypothetical protein
MFYLNILLSWYLELWFCSALLSYSQECFLLHCMILGLLAVVCVFDSVVALWGIWVRLWQAIECLVCLVDHSL